MTEFERKMLAMTPAQRKKATAHIGEVMGMSPKRKTARKKAVKK